MFITSQGMESAFSYSRQPAREEDAQEVDGTPFLTGVNYWPRRKAMYWWSDFDEGEVADEFDVISHLGMDVVRIFLLWDDFQPSPDAVSPLRLRDLTRVCDLAAERDLGLDVTFFTGHMSGPSWAPRWLLADDRTEHPSPHVRQVLTDGRVVDSTYRNMFHDEMALAAERLLLTTVVTELADHDGIWMWNLGNEPDLFAYPETALAGQTWVGEMTDLIRSIDDRHTVTTGLHAASLLVDNGLRVDQVFDSSDVAVMHGYPMYIPWARGNLDPDFVPYLCALATALSDKPCLAEEWGGCTAPDAGPSVTWEWSSYGRMRTQFMANEEELADFVGSSLPRLVEVGATGAFLWCFADYATELWHRPPCDDGGARHERHFGLVRPDGTLKPHAEVIRSFAVTKPTVQTARRRVDLDVTPDDYYRDPSGHAQRLYESF
jgi:endo-1,4-beta-mannosidase